MQWLVGVFSHPLNDGRGSLLFTSGPSWPTNNNNGLADYTLNNPDTLTKYKTAAQISHKVLEAVTGNNPLPRFVWLLVDRR